MSYTRADYRGDSAREFAQRARPMGLGLSAVTAARIDRIHWIASSFTDPGPDWSRFDLFDAEGNALGSITEPGY